MNFLSLICVERQKIKRTKILPILTAAGVILWIPSILHSDLNFDMAAEGISPEHNFFIQGFLAMSWFLFPAVLVISTVLLNQTERANKGILKMLALPVGTVRLNLAKFFLLLMLAAAQISIITVLYYASAAAASALQDYSFILPLSFTLKRILPLFISAIPMAAFFWMLSVCIRTPVFSMGIGLASIVPSVLIINTKVWFLYPMCYPFFLITSEYGRLALHLETAQAEWIPWIPAALIITVVCLTISCLCFGRAERSSL